jgi:hypothetical protein
VAWREVHRAVLESLAEEGVVVGIGELLLDSARRALVGGVEPILLVGGVGETPLDWGVGEGLQQFSAREDRGERRSAFA